MIAVPARSVAAFIEAVLPECERNRRLYIAFFVVAMAIGALSAPGGYIENFAIGSAMLSGSAGGIGFISRWRGWLDR